MKMNYGRYLWKDIKYLNFISLYSFMPLETILEQNLIKMVIADFARIFFLSQILSYKKIKTSFHENMPTYQILLKSDRQINLIFFKHFLKSLKCKQFDIDFVNTSR